MGDCCAQCFSKIIPDDLVLDYAHQTVSWSDSETSELTSFLRQETQKIKMSSRMAALFRPLSAGVGQVYSSMERGQRRWKRRCVFVLKIKVWGKMENLLFNWQMQSLDLLLRERMEGSSEWTKTTVEFCLLTVMFGSCDILLNWCSLKLLIGKRNKSFQFINFEQIYQYINVE